MRRVRWAAALAVATPLGYAAIRIYMRLVVWLAGSLGLLP